MVTIVSVPLLLKLSFQRQTELGEQAQSDPPTGLSDQGTLEGVELCPKGIALGIGGVIHAVCCLSALLRLCQRRRIACCHSDAQSKLVQALVFTLGDNHRRSGRGHPRACIVV